MTAGTVGILNVGAGDIELKFDSANPSEVIRACRIVKDLVRRGYALLVEVERDGEKRFERALDFDEKHCRYIIADYDPTVEPKRDEPRLRTQHIAEEGSEENNPNGEGEQDQAEAATPGDGADGAKRRGRPRKTVDAKSTRAVAVGRSSGG